MHEMMHVLGLFIPLRANVQAYPTKVAKRQPRPMEFYVRHNVSGYILGGYFDPYVWDEDLKDYCTSDKLGFSGTEARIAYDPQNPQDVPIHSPHVFRQGKSVTHWKEGTHSGINQVQNDKFSEPTLRPNEFSLYPGVVTLAAMKDIGWDTQLSIEEVGSRKSQWRVYPNPVEPNSEISVSVINDNVGATHRGYMIMDLHGKTVKRGNFEPNDMRISLTGLGPGIYVLSSSKSTGEPINLKFVVK